MVDIPREFLFELARAIMEARSGTVMRLPAGAVPTVCGYHCHAEDEKCYLTETSCDPGPVKGAVVAIAQRYES